jgi:toxin ParE1/3/4
MTDFIISPSASRDLEQISEYFLSRNVDAGEKLLQKFQAKCRYLVSFPNIGRPYDYLKTGLRGLPLEGYIILYEIIEDKVTILRVVSGYRNLESLFSEDE